MFRSRLSGTRYFRPPGRGFVSVVGSGAGVWARLGAALALLALLASAPARAQEPGQPYLLDVGDVVAVTVLGQPELSGEFAVAETGEVLLPLVGAVAAAGVDVLRLQQRIAARLGEGYLKNPRLSVSVHQRRPFYILGSVNRPGGYPHVAGLTVLQAVALAGGYLAAAPRELRASVELSRLRGDFALLSSEYRTALLLEARLLAERQGEDEVAVPDLMEIIADRAELSAALEGEQRMLELRRTALQNEKAALERVIDSHREEVEVLESQTSAVQRQSDLVREQIQEFERMAARGLIPKNNILEFRRSEADLDVKRLELMARILRAKQEIEKNGQRLFEIDSVYQQETLQALLDIRSRLGALRERLRITRDALEQNASAVTTSSGRQQTTIRIVRNGADGAREFAAAETTPVLPGDVVRISGEVPEPAVPGEGELSRQGD